MNMKKWLSSFVLASALLLSACGEEESKTITQAEGDFPITLTDALGKDVTVEKAPEKVVSLIQSNTEILFALGLEDEVVGVNDFDNYPPEVEGKERIGSMEYNVEKIIALQPDIVFAHESGTYGFEAGIEQLEAVGIDVFVVKNAVTFEETYETIEEIGQLTGKVAEAEEINADIAEKLEEVQAKIEGQPAKSAFLLVGATPSLYAAGTNTFMDEMLKAIHVNNVVQVEGWPEYSAEDFVASNPDTIIVTYAEDVTTLKNNPAFANMTAIQQDALKIVDGDTTSRQGPRLAEGVESMAKAMYPEAFGE